MVFPVTVPAGTSMLLINIDRKKQYNSDEWQTDKDGKRVYRAVVSMKSPDDRMPNNVNVNVHTAEDLDDVQPGVVRGIRNLQGVVYGNSQISLRCDAIDMEDMASIAEKARAYDAMVERQRQARAQQTQTAEPEQPKRRRGLGR